ncbi:RraA family protein [Ramlibacter sp. RBP-2]|uniref:Putative 4-hydroxy-4-methyl-2-oxoglutarate aldolase n=1 Tax=Ramlibacter lithotrophicus TaxID=2606681 RepID=A0A7X6I8J4_9BURK|nr:RraA family protein [Ramlibacter lithotrophicus]NKE68483.1 RraA family protein [Ramlibacter lithotrophicus]
MLTFGPDFPRPPAALLALYRELPVATVSDVLGPGHVLHARVKPLAPGMRVLGPAYTLRLPVSDNLGMHVAVKDAQPGDVVVADQQGGQLAAPVGEIMAAAAHHKGLAGIVLDGVVRDAARLRAAGWPVFATGVHAQQCRKDGPAWLREPMTCAGVEVRSGDIVLGDDDGVVVIPLERAEAVAREVVQKIEKESQRIAAISEGVVSPAWLVETMERVGIVNR